MLLFRYLGKKLSKVLSKLKRPVDVEMEIDLKLRKCNENIDAMDLFDVYTSAGSKRQSKEADGSTSIISILSIILS